MTATQRLWFALLVAPIAWIIQGLLGWAVGSGICTAWSVGTVRIAIGVLSILMLACAAAGLMTGIRNWREVRREPRAAGDRVEFMSLGGVFVSTAFVIGIAWSGLAAVFINVCGRTR
jgi:hypothetical protein